MRETRARGRIQSIQQIKYYIVYKAPQCYRTYVRRVPMPGGQCAVYEFTLPQVSDTKFFSAESHREEYYRHESDVHKLLRPHCKKYTFQLECGESGYLHYQGRLSLYKKAGLSSVVKLFGNLGWRLSPTCGNALKGEAFYCMKEQTRVENGGPWTEKDYIEPRVPSNRLVNSGILDNPYPWQAELKERLEKECDRTVHMVVDPTGNNGKSIFVEWIEYLGLSIEMPGFNSAEDFLQAAMNLPELKVYLVDLPRAMPKKHLNGLFTAVEKLKNGYMCDKRYHFKWKRLKHSPSICLFSNKKPKLKYLSRDRWRIFSISKDKRLVDYCYAEEEVSGKDPVQEDQEEVIGMGS